MELIKKTVKAGNSSAVTLPKSWLNKEVRIELVKKSKETILDETLKIIENYIETNEIIGIYLTGSYARNEEDEKSDIDIIIITENTFYKKALQKEFTKSKVYTKTEFQEQILTNYNSFQTHTLLYHSEKYYEIIGEIESELKIKNSPIKT